MALEQHIAFAEQHGLPMQQKFPELLIQLISTRPSVCAEAMDAYSNLRSLALRVLHSDFSRHVKDDASDVGRYPAVVMRVYKTSLHDGDVQLPLSLLQSLSVVLSIWNDQNAEANTEAAHSVHELADALLHPDNNDQADDDRGLASAKLLDGGTSAVSVESVSCCHAYYRVVVTLLSRHPTPVSCSGLCWQNRAVTLWLDVRHCRLHQDSSLDCFFVRVCLVRRY
jgi:hypothetical protein